MSERTERLTSAAAAAIAAVGPSIEQAGSKLHTLTVEIEVDTRGTVSGAVAWVQLRVNMNRVLGLTGKGPTGGQRENH